ncbi:MAG: hypothetical protein KGH94_02820 [Candidatus Micrarchaeota archaeon]|nr:hypothetical protein [Candidatus Micrarchaeota archaeon]
MRGSVCIIPAVLLAVMLASISSAAFVGSSEIKAPAVILYNNTGSLTTITLTVTTGAGNVNFVNASEVANDTHESADTAAHYASLYTGKDFSHYNFTYSINDGGTNVSGPSAGAAMTLLAISALQNKPLRNDFTITGTINPDGTIGQIGGALDKISAASGAGLDLVLVPWVPQGDLEQSVYYIGEKEYGIPIVEVSNITQAASYAFSNMSGVAHEVSLNFSTKYNVDSLPASQLNCSNACNEAPFMALTNYTINATRSQINNISSFGGGTVAGQLSSVVDQATAIRDKGYLYVSADISFLSYLDAFYLSNYNTSRDQALSYMQGVQNGCSGLLMPQLTAKNYEYVIGAELRQGWAGYTINSTIAGFNATGSTRDEIITSMYTAGQAQAWCGAASTLYNYDYGGSPIAFSISLRQLALKRINRAAQYPGMYLLLARQAYSEQNYPVAILDADYAYSLSSAAQATPANVSQADAVASAIADNSTYGVWATQFSKEALFYTYESAAAGNSTLAGYYADEAYASAALASQLSNDTKSIYESLVPITSPTAVQPNSGSSNGYGAETLSAVNDLTARVRQLTMLVSVSLALLAGCIVLMAILAHKVLVLSAAVKRKGGRVRGR